jgi:hypothetical protein
MDTYLIGLHQKVRLEWHHVQDLDMSSIDLDIVQNKNARQILWHMMKSTSSVPLCEACGENVVWLNKAYQRFCSKKCSANSVETRNKARSTNLEKYGVDNPSKHSDVKLKIQEVTLERYGVRHPMQSPEIVSVMQSTSLQTYGSKFHIASESVRKTILQTNLQKYGVQNPQQDAIIRQKTINTNMERYGVHTTLLDTTTLDKIKQSCQAAYGVDTPFASPVIQSMIKQTNLQKYGVEHPMQNEDVKSYQIITNLQKYGVEHPTQQYYSDYALYILSNADAFICFAKDKAKWQMARMLDVDPTTITKYITKYNVTNYISNTSSLEVEMAEFLDELDIPYIQHDRTAITPLELDFYLPAYNVAIEMNGIYWHSEKFKHKNYHYNKWKSCHDQGIHLISIFEDLWLNDLKKVKAAIQSILGKRRGISIGARKLQILPVNTVHAKPFLNAYHLQGYVTGTHFGAFNDMMQLVGIMSFGMSRNQHFELKRFVTNGQSYPGLASKMFKYAQNELKFDNVVSFSDNTWFTGKMYNKLGFSDCGTILPAYKYFYKGKLVHCSTFTKKGIVSKFPHMTEAINNGMTEKTAMIELNIPRIYDCGKRKWTWEI